MLELKTYHDTDPQGEDFVSFVLEGDTYKIKDQIKELGFHWGFPLYVRLELGEAADDPMFKKNKRWNRTFKAANEGTPRCQEWLEEVRTKLNIQ